MIVYSGIKTEFLKSVENDTIAKEIENTVLEKMHRHTGDAEIRSWKNSMNYMYRVLSDAEIPDNSGIAIEYNIPQTSKRVDFIISGLNEEKKPGAVVIELKQWQSITAVDETDGLVDAPVETYLGGGNRVTVHPSYQVWSYAQLITDYNEYVQNNNITLKPCAYLHNYERKNNDPIDDPRYSEYTDAAPVFSSGQNEKLRNFIKKYIKEGDNKKTLYEIDNGKIKPSKSLQNSIANMMKGNKEFIMIDDQKVVYEEIVKYSTKCQEDKKKRTIICKGGPGTGKSVIAVNLLVELTKREQFVQYASMNSSPRAVYKKKLKGTVTMTTVDNMFKGTGTYFDVPKNAISTLLIDEAHRLREKSGMFCHLGENQTKEIIEAAYCSVFFIDDRQRVTTKDAGSVEEIKKYAKELNSEIIEFDLVSQFRCNGSDGYLSWVDNALDIRDTANPCMDEIDYDLQIIDNPNKLREIIIERNKENGRSRMLAGYCWNWISGGQDDSSIHDIVIDDFEMSWNMKSGTPFAISKSSIDEVGCIHTTQGLEFDYVGLIIGDDMRYEDGKVVTDLFKRARTDKSLDGLKGLYKTDPDKAKEKADELIKNTYRTLMTRGMKGCYIYCTDKNLAEYLKEKT